MENREKPFHALKIYKLNDAVRFKEPYYLEPPAVSPDAHALEVMTDLNFVPAATVKVEASLAYAHQMMVDRGVRMIFAVDEHKRMQGLMTATDLLGSRAEVVAKDVGIAREHLLVRHMMISVGYVEVLSLVDVVHARVGDIVATLRSSGRQHALVVDRDAPEDELIVRGIFSASQIARQLGIPVIPGNIEHTFGQIEEFMCRAQVKKSEESEH